MKAFFLTNKDTKMDPFLPKNVSIKRFFIPKEDVRVRFIEGYIWETIQYSDMFTIFQQISKT